MLHRERELLLADASERSLWRNVIGGSQDELLLWFALSSYEAFLQDAPTEPISSAERTELKAALQALLLGPSASTLPSSASSSRFHSLKCSQALVIEP